jgi:hypothetical protein
MLSAAWMRDFRALLPQHVLKIANVVITVEMSLMSPTLS